MHVTRRGITFLLIGATCFGLQWSVLYLLYHGAGWDSFFADLPAFALSAVVNYKFNQRFTWHDRDGIWFRYAFVAAIADLLNAGVLRLLEPHGEILAFLIAGLCSVLFSFPGHHFFTFRGEKQLPLPGANVNLRQALEGGFTLFMPARNEAKNIRRVINEALVWLSGLDIPFNVVIVENGSSDNTAEIVRDLSIANPEVILVHSDAEDGYGGALRSGIRTSLSTGKSWIGFCDSDGQFKPVDFAQLVSQAIREDAEICVGFRIKRADGLKRFLMGRAWHFYAQLRLGRYDAVDTDCGMKLFSRNAAARLAPYLIGSHAVISPEIMCYARLLGYPVAQAGVTHYPCTEGEQTGGTTSVALKSLKGLEPVRRNKELVMNGVSK